MAQTTFKRNIEDFVCENCGFEVKGNGFTNHCPRCLYSKHVDVFPGDRAEGCGGLMAPTGVELAKGEYVILSACLVCGKRGRNKAAAEDDIGGFLANMVK